MVFDWTRFLDSNHIQHVPGTQGNVEIHCPFCGASDHGQHMSVSLEGRGWHCWRNPTHKGKSAARLVQRLINCTWQRAVEMTGESSFHAVENLRDKVKAIVNKPKVDIAGLDLPDEFKSFTCVKSNPSSKPYVRYLRERGFGRKLPREMYYATRGENAGRIIIPVRYDDKLVGWTGRTISTRNSLRYKDEGEIKKYLPWYDQLKTTTAKTLVLTEGPFDALKVQLHGNKIGIAATCFFTAEPSESQVSFLHDLLPRFDRCVTLLDRGTLPATMRMLSSLRAFRLETGVLPKGLKDAGEITSQDQLLEALRT